MNYKISFQERAVLAMTQLSKQLPISLEQAKEQVQWLKKNTKTNQKGLILIFTAFCVRDRSENPFLRHFRLKKD